MGPRWNLVFSSLAAAALSVCALASAPGAEPRAAFRLSKARAEVAETVSATFEASWDPASHAFKSFRVPVDDGATSWSLRLLGEPPDPDPETGLLKARLEVQGWELGAMWIEPPSLTVQANDGTVANVLAEPAGLEIVPTEAFKALLEDKPSTDGALRLAAKSAKVPDPRGMKSFIGPPPTWWERWGPTVGASLALLAGAFIAARILKWLSRPKPVYVPAPHEWAAGEFQKLEGVPLDTQDQIEDFHFRLAEILRLYCGRRWTFPSAKMTTDELAMSLEKLAPDLPKKRREEMVELMEDADMVKFARYPAAAITCRERLHKGRQFVSASTPPDDAPGGAPEAENQKAQTA